MSSNKVIQYILNTFYPAFKKKHKQPIRVIRAIEPQRRCRTENQGSNFYRCPHDGEIKEVFHSCRNSGCTLCGENKRNKWLETQKERLLNCEHFHVVFTLPHEYQALWLYNRKWFINTQFKVSSETLNNLLKGNSYKGKKFKGKLDAVPGFISTLHTWGRSLNLHPHIHILVTAGGLNNDDEWISIDNDYLLPIKKVKKLYRGKFQSEIKKLILSNEVNIPKGETKSSLLKMLWRLYEKEWNVSIKEKYDQGKGVLIYLSRYLGSSPVKPDQIELINHNKEVLFSYWSHRDNKQVKQRLDIDSFLKKYLMHQAEPYVHTIRYYGLYASQAKSKRESCVALLGETQYKKENSTEHLINSAFELLCSCCGSAMRLSHVSINRWKLKNPLYRRSFKTKGYFDAMVAPMPSG